MPTVLDVAHHEGAVEVTLAAEAFSREEISLAKLLEIGDLLGLHKDSLLEVIEA